MRYFRAMLWMTICLLLLGWVQGNTPVSAEPSNQTVLMFEVSGNAHIPAEEILGVVTTKIGEPLNSQALQNDIQRIAGLGYFADSQLKTEKFLNGVKLVYCVTENPIFKEVHIHGLTKLKSDELQPMFTQKPGEVFNTVTFENDINAAERYVRGKKGLVLTHKVPNGISADGIVDLELSELKVGKITITGLKKTKEIVVRRELAIKEGQILDANVVNEDIFRLSRLHLFTNIIWKMEIGDIPDALNLIIEIDEAENTAEAQFAISYLESTGQLGGQIGFSQNNLLGLNRNISFDTEFSEDAKKLSVSYTDPWIDKQGTSFRISAWTSDDEFTSTLNCWGTNNPLYPAGDPYNLDLHRTGLLLSFGRRLQNDTTARLRLNFEQNLIDNFYLRSDWDKETSLIDSLDESHNPREFWDNSLGVELVKNKLQYDGIYFVKGGYQLSGSLALAGSCLGGEFDYQSASLDGRWFKRLPFNSVFGTRLQASCISGDYPDYDQLYLGGMQRLRGYKENRFYDDSTQELIGPAYLLSNTELRYRSPSQKWLEFALFYDVGQTINSGAQNLKYDYGFGMRLGTPIGLIRIDRARNSDGEVRDVISVGEIF